MTDIDNQTKAIKSRLEDLSKIYNSLGLVGYLSVIGGFLITGVFTSVIFKTKAGESWINLETVEIAAFLITGVILIAIGSGFLSLKTYLTYKAYELEHLKEIRRIEAAKQTLKPGEEGGIVLPEK